MVTLSCEGRGPLCATPSLALRCALRLAFVTVKVNACSGSASESARAVRGAGVVRMGGDEGGGARVACWVRTPTSRTAATDERARWFARLDEARTVERPEPIQPPRGGGGYRVGSSDALKRAAGPPRAARPTFHNIILHYITLHCIAVHYSTSHYIGLYIVLHFVTQYCITRTSASRTTHIS